MLPFITSLREHGMQALKPTKTKLLALSTAILIGAVVLPVAASAATSGSPIVVDVRTPEEYQVSHLTGAINIPYHQIVEKIAIQGVSKSAPIKLYSRGGSRAEQAKQALLGAGYTNVEIQVK